MKKNNIVLYIIPAILLTMMPLRMIAYHTRTPELWALGLSTILSPWPYAFSRFKMLEPITFKHTFLIEFENGQSKVITLDNKSFKRLEFTSPYTKSLILKQYGLSPLNRFVSQKLYSNINQNFFCKSSILKKAFYPKNEALKVKIKISELKSKQIVFNDTFMCEKKNES